MIAKSPLPLRSTLDRRRQLWRPRLLLRRPGRAPHGRFSSPPAPARRAKLRPNLGRLPPTPRRPSLQLGPRLNAARGPSCSSAVPRSTPQARLLCPNVFPCSCPRPSSSALRFAVAAASSAFRFPSVRCSLIRPQEVWRCAAPSARKMPLNPVHVTLPWTCGLLTMSLRRLLLLYWVAPLMLSLIPFIGLILMLVVLLVSLCFSGSFCCAFSTPTEMAFASCNFQFEHFLNTFLLFFSLIMICYIILLQAVPQLLADKDMLLRSILNKSEMKDGSYVFEIPRIGSNSVIMMMVEFVLYLFSSQDNAVS